MVTFGEPLKHATSLRGQFLVIRKLATRDETQHPVKMLNTETNNTTRRERQRQRQRKKTETETETETRKECKEKREDETEIKCTAGDALEHAG